MSNTSSQIEALDAEATGTRVVFEWSGDRFHHAIYGVRLGVAVLLAESVEGDATDPWPPSPPLQQLHKQSHPSGGEMLLLTGMAGRSHWSGSISKENDQRWTRVYFEFACRHRVKPDWLGVTYRPVDGIRAEQSPAGNGVFFHLDDSLQCELHASAIEVSIATESLLTSSIELVDSAIRIAAKETPHMATATTIRWAYELRLTRPYWVVK